MAQKKILIVGNEPTDTLPLLATLSADGYLTERAPDQDAIPIAILFQPDAIVLSGYLSQRDGIALGLQLKAALATRNIPIVFMRVEEHASTVPGETGPAIARQTAMTLEALRATLRHVTEAQCGEATLRPKRIVVAEGEADILANLARRLLDAGYTLERTRDTLAFWDALTTLPDLILIDISTPYIDVCEVYGRLKGNPLTAHIPIFLLTTGTAAQKEIIAHMAVKEIITKPVVMERFVEVVARHVCDSHESQIEFSSR